MHRICLCLIYACLLTLCACAGAEPVQAPAPEAVVDEVIAEPASPEPTVEEVEDEETPPCPPLPVLELKLTEEPKRYKPTPSIVPLTNSRNYYSGGVTGDITFIRAADQTQVKLPTGVVNYYPVRASEDGAMLAYALSDTEYKIAFMSVNGEMLTDFIYDILYDMSGDYVVFPNHYGYASVLRDGGYGMLDLRSGKEVILPEYDETNSDAYGLEPLKYAVLAYKDEHFQLLDYVGQVLYDLPDAPEIVYSDFPNAEKYQFYGSGYAYFAACGEVYSHMQPQEQSLYLYNGMILIATNYNSKIKIYDEEGRNIFANENIDRYYFSGGAILLCYANGQVDNVTPEAVTSISIPEKALVDHSRFSSFSFDGENVTFTYDDERDHCLQNSVTYNLQGTKISESSEYRYDENNHTRMRYEPYSHQLEDDFGNIIIPFGIYPYINTYGPFAVGYDDNYAFDILNMRGEVLIHGPWGAIRWECDVKDFMVVWLDEQNCVFLYPDGSMEPIANPPQVELMYFGG